MTFKRLDIECRIHDEENTVKIILHCPIHDILQPITNQNFILFFIFKKNIYYKIDRLCYTDFKIVTKIVILFSTFAVKKF